MRLGLFGLISKQPYGLISRAGIRGQRWLQMAANCCCRTISEFGIREVKVVECGNARDSVEICGNVRLVDDNA